MLVLRYMAMPTEVDTMQLMHLNHSGMCTSFGSDADDFGASLYLECITNSTSYPNGDWMHTLESGRTSLPLTDLNALRASGVFVPDDPDFSGWRYEPEIACMQACEVELGTKCRMFTYDGISDDRSDSH
jgi:hypothetical protein